MTRSVCGVAILLVVVLVTPGAAAADSPLTSKAFTLKTLTGADAVDGLGCNGPLIGNQCIAIRCTNCMAPIPDQDLLSQTLNITAQALEGLGLRDCIINDVNVAVELDHGNVGDLAIDFLRPSPGPDVSIYFPPASCSATAVDAIFDDESANPANACPAVGGTILQPDDSLDPFVGEDLVGQWTMEVFDLLPGDSGTMEAWGFAADVTCQNVGGGGPCVEGPNTLCLNNDRFRVETNWATAQGTSGMGNAVELTDDTGYFWFFDAANVEMVTKVLNACGFSNHFWVFAGGLTNVEVQITVTDTDTGAVQTYMNPLGTPFQPIQDTDAFATCP